jgi:hypothetical protein
LMRRSSMLSDAGQQTMMRGGTCHRMLCGFTWSIGGISARFRISC